MSKQNIKDKYSLSETDRQLFKESVIGTKKLLQNTVIHQKYLKNAHIMAKKRLQTERDNSCFYFSDLFHLQLEKDSPTRYLRSTCHAFELKKLSRGDYTPELWLDLHGFRQLQAKQALGEMIITCKHKRIYCACVIHGHGKHILKQQLPVWLTQHPDVLAFHEAPKKWGGTAALLLLINPEEE